ncbi:MAG TPA: hypothetical protein VJ925_07480 [Longimicrobiales bacterium]|nr:hypothetical protein [Longimicrobiales bacterium]
MGLLGNDAEEPRSYEFEPADPDDPYDMDFAEGLATRIFLAFVVFGITAGAVLWLRLPN